MKVIERLLQTNKNREFVTSRPALQKIVKKFFREREGK